MADVSDLRIDHSAGARSRSGARLAIGALVAACVLAAVGGVAWLLQSTAQDKGRGDAGDFRAEAAPSGSSAKPAPPNAAAAFTAAGYVEVVPPGARVISSLVLGILDDIKVQEGEHVRAGDLVAALDTSPLEQELVLGRADFEVLRARLARLEAGYLPEEIAQAEARAHAAAAQRKIVERRLDGRRELAERGILSHQLVLEVEAELVEADRAVAEAEAELRIKRRGARPEDVHIARAELARAEAVVQHTKWKLGRCAIVSPIDGVVFQQLAQPGQWISADSAIMSVFDPESLQAWVDITQRDVSRVHIGQRATMIADALPGKTIEGAVIQFMPRASIERNTVRIKIAIEGEHDGLRPDMSLKVTFHE